MPTDPTSSPERAESDAERLKAIREYYEEFGDVTFGSQGCGTLLRLIDSRDATIASMRSLLDTLYAEERQYQETIAAQAGEIERLKSQSSEMFDIAARWQTEAGRLAGELARLRIPTAPVNVGGQPEADGWRLVPIEPTEEMHAAANREWDGRMSARSAGVWQAMINAAPPAPAEDAGAGSDEPKSPFMTNWNLMPIGGNALSADADAPSAYGLEWAMVAHRVSEHEPLKTIAETDPQLHKYIISTAYIIDALKRDCDAEHAAAPNANTDALERACEIVPSGFIDDTCSCLSPTRLVIEKKLQQDIADALTAAETQAYEKAAQIANNVYEHITPSGRTLTEVHKSCAACIRDCIRALATTPGEKT